MSAPMLVQLTADQLAEIVRREVKAVLDERPVHTAPTVLDSEAAARFLSIPTDSLRKRVRSGEIPSFKIGTLLRFRVSELEQYIDSRKGKR